MVLSAVYKDDANGIPHYMGLTGRTLSLAVSVVATNGFLLFGYVSRERQARAIGMS